MNDPLFFRGRTGVTSIHLPPSDPLAVSNQVREHASNAELESEQAYIDHAYACLERTRHAISALKDTTDSGPGGTFQARYERDVIYDQVAQRLSQLDLGDQSLVFGRIDKAAHSAGDDGSSDGAGPLDRYYIGRIAVADERQDPVVVDWRAPVSEAFYRATGRNPMELVRRRHFATRGRELLGLEDELFGDAADGLRDGTVQGEGALIAALESARSGKLSDIVATIQGEQDEVIRAELSGPLVVQGGPGTGKTVVALHRAAYLLYTHRFPLEGQGVLVIGPNRLFLSYIEQVLPSLGEAGVEIAVLADLVPHVRASASDPPEVARLKGDLRMVRLLSKAVRDRQRPLRRSAVIPSGVEYLRVSPEESAELVAFARRRARGHNSGRKHLETAFFSLLSSKMREPMDPGQLRDRLRETMEVREALERMWPVLGPNEFLNDLYGSMPLLRLAGSKWFSEDELARLHRERTPEPWDRVWSVHDVPVLDEALELLGSRPRHRDEDGIRTYGHIVIDEAQDLSPMELRVIDRRSLNGSMTIVGDIAQATGAHAHDDWDGVLRYLPDRHAPRFAELTIGYRLPGPSMELASRVLRLAAPGLRPPTSVRATGDEPIVASTSPDRFEVDLAASVRREREAVGTGNVAVIVPNKLLARVEAALQSQGVDFGRAQRGSLDHQVTVTPVSLVKGLELDACIVVEPQTILDSEHRGAQSLYVALTRATKRLTVLHERPLPEALLTHD
jgi:DNA helicase IV